jgi:transglutaminase-like putative cysteine protease
MIATWAIGATGWTKGITMITFVGLGSILIGTMLARSILPWFLAHTFSLIIGLGWSFWVTSRLLPAHYTWPERWSNLADRLNMWYGLASQGGTSYDNLMFIFQMGVIVWLMGYLMIWFVFRSEKVWPAIVPGGLVLLINLYYAPKDITFWFILYLLVSLLLVIRFNLFGQEKVWRSEGTFFRPDISFDFLRDGFIFSALVIAFAWLTPPLVDVKTLGLFDEFQGSWRDVQNEWNRMFADLNYRDRVAFDTFGASLKLGGPRRLTDEPVMDVQVDGIGRYWRAVVYDFYTGDGWLTRDEDKANIGPNESLSLPSFAAREAVTQTFTFYRDNATVLYAMSNPVNLDRSARVTFNALSNQEIANSSLPAWPDSGQPWAEEITYVRSNATVDRGESYQVISLASRATAAELTAAGNDYPNWISERYLQLPDSITERTHELAREVTQSYDNNYAKAQAIERFLRAELKYNEALATPPPNVDKVDYILFEAKEAYCDYYASSMIVMLRSLGIPARLAAGFARGTYEAEVDSFHVLNKDAHSWVEVYFPEYGWIEFEPTAAQPTIIRPNTAERDDAFASGFMPGNEDLQPDQFADRPDGSFFDEDASLGGSLPLIFNIPFIGTQISLPRPGGGSLLLTLSLIVASAAGGFWWFRRNQDNCRANVFTRYQGMVKMAGWMGVALRPWQTPFEHAAVLQRNLPAHSRDVEAITSEYVYQTFRNKNGTEPTGRRGYTSRRSYQSALAWNRLRPAMLKEALRHHLPKWLRK